jgi:hypothetical protein
MPIALMKMSRFTPAACIASTMCSACSFMSPARFA